MLGLLLLVAACRAQSQAQPFPCLRYSGQLAVAGDHTVYYQGGLAKLAPDQTSSLWTNALVKLDLSTNWTTGSPPLAVVTPDNGNIVNPFAVARMLP